MQHGLYMPCACAVFVHVCVSCSSHQLHEALAALRGDDAEVRLTTAHHLRAGRRGGFGWDHFPHAITVWDSGNGEEAWGGPGTDVTISCREREETKCVMGVCIYTKHTGKKLLKKSAWHTHTNADIYQCFCVLPGKTQWLNICTAGRKISLSLI